MFRVLPLVYRLPGRRILGLRQFSGDVLEGSVQPEAPSQVLLEKAREASDARRKTKDLEDLVAKAETPQKLLQVCNDLAQHWTHVRASAWSEAAARAVQLADKLLLPDWSLLLTAFRNAQHVDAAFLDEAESALRLATDAEFEVVANCIASLERLNLLTGRHCDESLLKSVATRLSTKPLLTLSVVTGLGSAFSRAGLKAEALQVILPVLEMVQSPNAEDIAQLAWICRDLEVGSSASLWLVPQASQLLLSGDPRWPKVLPLLTDRDPIAYRHAIQILIPEMLRGQSTREELSQVLEALSMAEKDEQDLQLIYRVASKYVAFAEDVDLPTSVKLASSLAHLGVRKEMLMNKLARNLVKHERHFTRDIIEVQRDV